MDQEPPTPSTLGPKAEDSSKNRFTGQTAVVTGAASGLGLAIARRLRAEGAFVVLVDQDMKAFESLAREFGSEGHCVKLDVTREDDVGPAMESILGARGQIDVLVNSAGITGATNIKSHEVTLGDFSRVMSINVAGPFLMSKHVLPSMRRRKYGRILNIASIAGKEGNAGMLAYSTSKAALIGLTKVQGKEYAEEGITVNALAPAVIRTPLVEAMPDAQVKYMTDKIPMKRCGSLDEVASIAAFIVSPEASFTTGFVFDLTGGRAVY